MSDHMPQIQAITSMIPEGLIEPDSITGQALSYTSDRFSGWLWRKGDDVYVSMIVSRQRGNFRDLVGRIHALGLTVKVPTPLGRMRDICQRNGYRETQEFDEQMLEYVEVWVWAA